jgi:hypothetical protein
MAWWEPFLAAAREGLKAAGVKVPDADEAREAESAR